MKTHLLQDYIRVLEEAGLLTGQALQSGAPLRPVACLSCNSREEMPDGLFLCKGAHFLPEYVSAAASAGAFCYVSQEDYKVPGLSALLVSDVRRAMVLLADFHYGSPWRSLDLIGITGTKGKSSTVYYLKYILDEHLAAQDKPSCGLLSSIDVWDGVQRFEAHLTTPDAVDLERHLRNAADAGMSALGMEVSSQALKYGRVAGVRFSVGCFLNIGADHISPIEHPDAEDYFQSKLRLFPLCETACVNLDSDRADEVLAAAQVCRRVITFSAKNPAADVYAGEIRKSGGDILFRARTPRYTRELRLTMPGLFNVENALAAIAVCEALGIHERFVYAGLMKARVPGRMEVYTSTDRRVTAIVDYAHNRMSFERLFLSVREEYPGQRVTIVFGCPGGKALERRRDLGEVAGRYADRVILTEEDAGGEEVEAISREIARHVSCPSESIPHRGEAIERAILDCGEAGGVVLITGKGAETRQKRGSEYVPCPSDVEYARQALRRYDAARQPDTGERPGSLEAMLPVFRTYKDLFLVIKCGGSALDAATAFLPDIAALHKAGARVVLVHGGGPAISDWLSRLGAESVFQDGLRVTDDDAMDIAEMTLSGQLGKALVAALSQLGVPAAGISGRDGALLRAEPLDPRLGRVGRVKETDPLLLHTLLNGGFLPVVSPVACGADGRALNVNADEAACAIAQALQAHRLIFLTDTDGILVDSKNKATRIAQLNAARARELIADGFVGGGMIPKLENCIRAVENGVQRVLILDGRPEHCILRESIAASGVIGTVITKN